MSLSIIIPVYNVEKYISKCLDSILVDNAFSGQVICVNDGSTDGSLSILEQYAARYPNLEILSQNNAGLSVARNVGFDRATGDYVFFVDSDDWIIPGAIEIVLHKVSGEDVLYFNAKIYDESKHSYKEAKDIPEITKTNGQTYFATVYGRANDLPSVCVWGGVYSRSFLKNNNIYHEPHILHEDAYFTPQILLAAQSVSSVNEYVYVYRIRKGSIMTSMTERNIKDLLFISRQLYDMYNRRGNVIDMFYHELFDKYVNIINIGYNLSIPVHRFWKSKDSKIMLYGARDSRERKIGKLSLLSPRFAYQYMQNRFASVIRKAINRFL